MTCVKRLLTAIFGLALLDTLLADFNFEVFGVVPKVSIGPAMKSRAAIIKFWYTAGFGIATEESSSLAISMETRRVSTIEVIVKPVILQRKNPTARDRQM